MRPIIVVLILLVLFEIVQSQKDCPYGWYLSDDETTCYVDCLQSQLYFSNAYCNFIALKRANVSYDSATKILSMPSGHSMGRFKTSLIPPCYEVTLKNDQYNVTSDGFIQIATYLMDIPLKSVIKMTSSNVTLCYPSSPQLLQCNALRVLPGSYKIVNGKMLEIPKKNITAILGDFYVNNEAIAFFCPQSSPNVSFTNVPRCNMVVLQHTDYLINHDGSMNVLKANVTIKNPSHSINYSQHAIVCFPLNFDYLNCPLRETIPEYNYKMYPNLTVLNTQDRGLVEPFDYHITVSSQLSTCVTPQNPTSPLAIIKKMYYSFCMLSSVTLFLTVTFRFKMFTQNYHNRCLWCHLVSLCVMYFSLGSPLFYSRVELYSCYFLFVLYYFFNMAAFLWLNVIVYDSWCLFSRAETVQCLCVTCENCWAVPYDTLPHYSVIRFGAYNVFCWGLATILTAVILFLDLGLSPFDFRYKVRPYILPICFFTTTKAFIWFLIFPLSVTTVISLIFLGLIIRILYRTRLGTEVVNHLKRTQIFKISLKLFLLTGFCWAVDCVGFGFSVYESSVFISWYWYVALGFTSVQGLVVSFIYCARQKNFDNICARHRETQT